MGARYAYTVKSSVRCHGANEPVRSPPILPGENPKAYEKILDRMIDTIGPRDFIEEIWCRDLVDVAFNLFHLRRIKAAYQADKVSEAANKEASRLAEAAMRAMQDSDEDKIQQFLACDPRWNRASAYPRAYQIYQQLLAKARSALNMNLIQANVTFSWLFDYFERIAALILADEQRFDEIMRELHRHRFMQSQVVSLPSPEQAKRKKSEPKMIAAKATTDKPHDE
jgi:hypothetical protein